jgi:four helix bundle protein
MEANSPRTVCETAVGNRGDRDTSALEKQPHLVVNGRVIRFSEHVTGGSFATSHRGPWQLIYYEAYLNQADALGRERMFNFEKLDVWQEAIQFADLVYELTGNFPDEERFGLTNQMRRAAVSVSSNIAEGSSRVSRTDFSRFVEIATGSLFEVVSQTTIALRRKMISQNDYNRIYVAAEKQSKMLSGLRRSLSEM